MKPLIWRIRVILALFCGNRKIFVMCVVFVAFSAVSLGQSENSVEPSYDITLRVPVHWQWDSIVLTGSGSVDSTDKLIVSSLAIDFCGMYNPIAIYIDINVL